MTRSLKNCCEHYVVPVMEVQESMSAPPVFCLAKVGIGSIECSKQTVYCLTQFLIIFGIEPEEIVVLDEVGYCCTVLP